MFSCFLALCSNTFSFHFIFLFQHASCYPQWFQKGPVRLWRWIKNEISHRKKIKTYNTVVNNCDLYDWIAFSQISLVSIANSCIWRIWRLLDLIQDVHMLPNLFHFLELILIPSQQISHTSWPNDLIIKFVLFSH